MVLLSRKMPRLLSFFLLLCFIFNPFSSYLAQAQVMALPGLPKPNQLLAISSPYSSPVLKGIRFNPADPLRLEFIVDCADKSALAKEEAAKLVRYFLAGLTLPEDDLWVNLSPYEENRIVPQALSQTDLGKDLLGEDYILKQLASSLTYPESDTGKAYWQEIQGNNTSRTTPANSFTKVWIMPDKATIYENKNTAFITESSLKVMTEEDYLAKQKSSITNTPSNNNVNAFKSRILPVIIKEVNQGQNFACLRQIYNALMLSVWFKDKFKQSFYKSYIDQKKINGIDINDKSAKKKIYALYVEAFKNGVYNYVKKERVGANSYSPVQKITRRQYFSGGVLPASHPKITPDLPTSGLTSGQPTILDVGLADGTQAIQPGRDSVADNPTADGSQPSEESSSDNSDPYYDPWPGHDQNDRDGEGDIGKFKEDPNDPVRVRWSWRVVTGTLLAHGGYGEDIDLSKEDLQKVSRQEFLGIVNRVRKVLSTTEHPDQAVLAEIFVLFIAHLPKNSFSADLLAKGFGGKAKPKEQLFIFDSHAPDKYPVLFFHEMVEYLVALGVVRLSVVTSDILVVDIGEQYTSGAHRRELNLGDVRPRLIDRHKEMWASGQRGSFAYQLDEPHYLIRLLEALWWPDADRRATVNVYLSRLKTRPRKKLLSKLWKLSAYLDRPDKFTKVEFELIEDLIKFRLFTDDYIVSIDAFFIAIDQMPYDLRMQRVASLCAVIQAINVFPHSGGMRKLLQLLIDNENSDDYTAVEKSIIELIHIAYESIGKFKVALNKHAEDRRASDRSQFLADRRSVYSSSRMGFDGNSFSEAFAGDITNILSAFNGDSRDMAAFVEEVKGKIEKCHRERYSEYSQAETQAYYAPRRSIFSPGKSLSSHEEEPIDPRDPLFFKVNDMGKFEISEVTDMKRVGDDVTITAKLKRYGDNEPTETVTLKGKFVGVERLADYERTGIPDIDEALTAAFAQLSVYAKEDSLSGFVVLSKDNPRIGLGGKAFSFKSSMGIILHEDFVPEVPQTAGITTPEKIAKTHELLHLAHMRAMLTTRQLLSEIKDSKIVEEYSTKKLADIPFQPGETDHPEGVKFHYAAYAFFQQPKWAAANAVLTAKARALGGIDFKKKSFNIKTSAQAIISNGANETQMIGSLRIFDIKLQIISTAELRKMLVG